MPDDVLVLDDSETALLSVPQGNQSFTVLPRGLLLPNCTGGRVLALETCLLCSSVTPGRPGVRGSSDKRGAVLPDPVGDRPGWAPGDPLDTVGQQRGYADRNGD